MERITGRENPRIVKESNGMVGKTLRTTQNGEKMTQKG